MNFNNHSNLEGQHAFLGASKYHWINYGEDKVAEAYRNFLATQKGTVLHAFLFDEDLMTFAMGNCITLEDTNGNRKLLKKRYEQKIDAVAAMMDAYIAFKANREAFE